MMSIQLASNFLFTTAFHTKKSLRGASNEWYDAICIHLRHSRMVRSWFAHNVLFMHSYRFGEYLLECPSSEVRTTFAKIIVFLAHFSLQDGPCPPPMIFGGGPSQLLDSNATLSDHILQAVLLLLKKEVSEHGRHLTQYFSLFMMYCSLGIPEVLYSYHCIRYLVFKTFQSFCFILTEASIVAIKCSINFHDCCLRRWTWSSYKVPICRVKQAISSYIHSSSLL